MIELFSTNEDMALYASYACVGFAVFVLALLGSYAKAKFRLPLLVISFVAFLGLSYGALGELLGRAKPVPLMTWDRPDVDKARVEYMFFIEGKSINLLLMYEGLEKPRWYQFPWSKEMAEKLQRGEANKELKRNRGLFLMHPFQRSWEDREFPEVHEDPWPAPRPKDAPDRETIDLDALDSVDA